MKKKNSHLIFTLSSFFVPLIIYLKTMAPTTSFWDCGEFIACSVTLGVPHPPGTPLFLLLGNVFSNIPILSDIGARVNLISPIASAFSVMFLYLIIMQLISIRIYFYTTWKYLTYITAKQYVVGNHIILLYNNYNSIMINLNKILLCGHIVTMKINNLKL